MPEDFQISITSTRNRPPFFVVSTASEEKDVLSMTAVGGYALYLQNTSVTKVIDIKKIMASASTPGVVLRWTKDVLLGEVENAILRPPVNISGTEEAEATCYKWNGIQNGIVGITEGAKVDAQILDIGYTSIMVNATLGRMDNIALHFKHPEGAPDIGCSLIFSYRDIEPVEQDAQDGR